ncbi:N-acetyltransferase family protein, partial [Salinispira pacifica]
MSGEFRLREIGPGDGPAIAQLDRESPDTGAVAFSTVYLQDPFTALLALHPGAVGVAAVTPGDSGILGMGAMTTGRCQYEGTLLPYAYLFNISVKPEFRRRGIASQIYSWLISTARERQGDDTVIIAGIQEGNEASVRAAQVWSSNLLRHSQSAMTRMRTSPPRPHGRLTVREATDGEWERIADAQNRFYRAYNLYPPRTAEELRSAHRAEPAASPLRR